MPERRIDGDLAAFQCPSLPLASASHTVWVSLSCGCVLIDDCTVQGVSKIIFSGNKEHVSEAISQQRGLVSVSGKHSRVSVFCDWVLFYLWSKYRYLTTSLPRYRLPNLPRCIPRYLTTCRYIGRYLGTFHVGSPEVSSRYPAKHHYTCSSHPSIPRYM